MCQERKAPQPGRLSHMDSRFRGNDERRDYFDAAASRSISVAIVWTRAESFAPFM